MAVQQLLREWPPGYGGVERVAHELALVWGGTVYSLDAQPQLRLEQDPLAVTYARQRLPRLSIGRLLLPLPSWRLLRLLMSSQPLHGHLPSPAVLLVLLLARVLHPDRRVTAHWHCFLERSPGISGWLYSGYELLAERFLPFFSGVITTSPPLAAELENRGCLPEKIHVLPCCLSVDQEAAALALKAREPDLQFEQQPMTVLFIGRLDSYKRVDWLLRALADLTSQWRLDVVGDGPKRSSLETLAQELFGVSERVQFHGRLNEAAKLQCLAEADVLVLPSDRSNEAFGIVQLEAMAAALPSLAFDLPRSGMGWVGQLPSLQWSQSQEGLADVLQRLSEDSELMCQASSQSRDRYKRLFARNIWLQHLNNFGFLQ